MSLSIIFANYSIYYYKIRNLNSPTHPKFLRNDIIAY